MRADINGVPVIKVVDSHTEGEPTRMILAGEPDLGPGPIADRVQRLRDHFDEWFAPLLREPRAYEAMVGAWIGEPSIPEAVNDVIFFNPAGPLGMCGHGTIGVMVSLASLGKIGLGQNVINTPAGIVTTHLLDANTVRIQNVPSWLAHADVTLDVPGYGPVTGDIAYGGNWFFLVYDPHLKPGEATLDEMTRYTSAIRWAANAGGYPEIDHVEIFGAPTLPEAQSKNFVLCPSGEYDRSPCGTGTSAKLASLFARGKLAAGEAYVQESVIGTRFRGSVEELGDGKVRPTIEGSAYVTGIADLIFNENDPLVRGIVL